MKKSSKGGGNTITGLKFEREVDFLTLLEDMPNYRIVENTIGHDVYYKNNKVARYFKKYNLYRFLEEENVDWKKILQGSKRIVPNDALLLIACETLFIIEIKCQQGTGSVYEKLQTCDFKRKKYLKLVSPIGLRVEYIYVLSDWFKSPKYKDVLDYIHSVNCHYKFNELPLAWLGLPAD